jgi:hypothetical protein
MKSLLPITRVTMNNFYEWCIYVLMVGYGYGYSCSLQSQRYPAQVFGSMISKNALNSNGDLRNL